MAGSLHFCSVINQDTWFGSLAIKVLKYEINRNRNKVINRRKQTDLVKSLEIVNFFYDLLY